MATLTITKKHQLTHAKAREAAEQVARDLRDRFALNYAWDGDCITFQRPGLSGALEVGADEVRLDCRLGLLLTALKPAIETEVHREFDKRFGPKR